MTLILNSKLGSYFNKTRKVIPPNISIYKALLKVCTYYYLSAKEYFFKVIVSGHQQRYEGLLSQRDVHTVTTLFGRDRNASDLFRYSNNRGTLF